MKHLIYWIVLVSVLANSCNNKNTNAQGKSLINADPVLIEKIAAANEKFKIKDFQALEMVKQVKKINELVDTKYQDPSVYNDIFILSAPSDTAQDWLLCIKQIRPKDESSPDLLKILVNANTGNVRIWEIINDTPISLQTWLNLNQN